MRDPQHHVGAHQKVHITSCLQAAPPSPTPRKTWQHEGGLASPGTSQLWAQRTLSNNPSRNRNIQLWEW